LRQQGAQQYRRGTPKSGGKHGVESVIGGLHHIALAWVKLKNHSYQLYSSPHKKSSSFASLEKETCPLYRG
jgi:hypothetical protein